MKRMMAGLLAATSLIPGGCPVDQRNAFLTLTEELGASSASRDDSSGGSGSGQTTSGTFRRTMTITLENTTDEAELNVSVAAWVNTGSIRSADQQDALISSGYVQLTHEERIGTAYTLPPGTFVYNGSGPAGSTRFVVPRATGGAASEDQMSLVTPDTILVYLMPPIGCETTAFVFTVEGFPFDSDPPNVDGVGMGIAADAGAYNVLGTKTLAQIDAYQCSPFRPGLFLKVGGGAQESNEFSEGENVRVRFFLRPQALGTQDFAEVILE
ncbi:MAG: hypothetical protein HZB38_04400 [Planctomycetes bacterium]|nr:hypothetical protein [Planctomycetota bacterium]